MISWHDLYTVLSAVVPLYVAMILAYGSVRWWGIFSPDQCSGINRFVAIFAVPLLSFHFISTNDPYAMNLRFVAADTLQKLLVLVGLVLWSRIAPRRYSTSLDWSITVFSLSTLPNTLVMGIPLLIAMYGPYSGSLMVQIVVLQCIIWYTLLLFLFEYRAAKLLISDQFPDTAGSIVSFRIDPDVMSLDGGREVLQTDAEVAADGKIHVTLRRSSASRRSLSLMTPRPSNLTGAEIYSLNSSRNPTPRGSNFNHSDFFAMVGGAPPLSHGPTPRQSNFEEHVVQVQPDTRPPAVPMKPPANHDTKELHMFVWSSNNSPVSDVGGLPVFGGGREFTGDGAKEIRMVVPADHLAAPNGSGKEEGEFSFGGGKRLEEVVEAERENGPAELSKLGSSSTAELHPKGGREPSDQDRTQQMPPASVMTRLILIMVWRKLIRNPNTYSSLIGLVWSLIAFRWHIMMPKIIEKSISILSDAGLGMAMFSLGLFMALQPKIIACGNSTATFAMAVRFFVGPAVMAVASIVMGLRGTLLHIAVVQAALPQGIVPFVFAKEYNVHPAILSTAVIFGMLIALPFTLVYYILLGL
ncbi:hypothetical protein LUZ60_000698 [Juncus effusus]|nr:hypothetical protein LUZ60_000698 [Juncus effusus]